MIFSLKNLTFCKNFVLKPIFWQALFKKRKDPDPDPVWIRILEAQKHADPDPQRYKAGY